MNDKSAIITNPQKKLSTNECANFSMQPNQVHSSNQSGRNFIIQPKLTVGAPDNLYEKEADTIADKVMRMPEQIFVQRKCTECEKEEKIQRQVKEDELPVQAKHINGQSFVQKKCAACEKEEEEKLHRKPISEGITPFIQTKSNGESTASDSLTSSIQNSRGGGVSLDSTTQSFMESRFGADFSSVKIHTGGEAIQMNKELNAQAFTVGSDVYFNEGKYQPASSEGKQLLAHELTHVIQQGGNVQSVYRKKDPSFEITGLYENRAGESGFVFFDIGQPDAALTQPEDALDKDEKQKIKDKAKANPPAVHLFGFSSEEGSPKEDNKLIDRRVSAVKNVLVGEGYDSSKIDTSKSNQRSLGRAHYDYRFWRAVEMADATESARKPKAGSTRGIAACTKDQKDIVEKATKDADDILKKLIKRLNDYVADPAKDADLKKALDFYFKDSSQNFVRNRLIHRFKKINSFVNKILKIVKCGTPLSQDCGSSTALTGPGEMTLCDDFYSGGYTTRKQAYLLIHESGHGSSEAIGDRGYQYERVFLFLSTDQALANADSFMLLAEEINEGKRSVDIISDTKDDAKGCDSNPDLKKKVREAVAWAQRLNTYALTGIEQTYGNDEFTQFMAPFFIAHFGNANRPAMAGILDRYLKMDKVFNQDLTFICKDSKDPVCATSSLPIWTINGEVTVCPDHLKDNSQSKRVNNMYAGLAAIMPGVKKEQQFSYPKLARNYKNNFWQELG